MSMAQLEVLTAQLTAIINRLPLHIQRIPPLFFSGRLERPWGHIFRQRQKQQFLAILE